MKQVALSSQSLSSRSVNCGSVSCDVCGSAGYALCCVLPGRVPSVTASTLLRTPFCSAASGMRSSAPGVSRLGLLGVWVLPRDVRLRTIANLARNIGTCGLSQASKATSLQSWRFGTLPHILSRTVPEFGQQAQTLLDGQGDGSQTSS